jgi:hypothetical protein
MRMTSWLNGVLRKVAISFAFVCAAATLLLTSAAYARPIKYTGFTITDGKLGQWKFHNARVYLSFLSDTDNVLFFQPLIDPAHPEYGTVDTYFDTTGVASVRIISGQRVVNATFAPGQIFVSLDLGDTIDAPHVGGRGVGFGSFSATAPGGIEPAYPLGIEDGTIDWGDILEDQGIASPVLATLSTDLQHDVAFGGRAWVCLGFPDFTCPPPTTPLRTDHGNLYLYQPYQLFYVDSTGTSYPDDSLSAGFFVADVSGDRRSDDIPTSALTAVSFDQSSSNSIRYNAYVISDVTLGKQHFTGAQVYLSFDADATTVEPFADGYANEVGRAHVKVISNGRSISADFAPKQLYVFYDVAHSNIGFGSYTGGIGYPLSLTDNEDPDGLTEKSTLGAVSHLTKCPPAGGDYCYSRATAGLATDLTNSTALSGAASSCVSLDPTTSTCTNLTPAPLYTTGGDFFLFEPYTADDTTTEGSQPHTVNWGVFWADRAPHLD